MGVRFGRLSRVGPNCDVLAVVSAGGRTFRVTLDADYGDMLVAFMHPSRTWHERIHGWVGGPREPIAKMRFKVFAGSGRRRGLVTNIAVRDSHQRQGWASVMVVALMQLYPDCTWTVESPNEKSGQLFVHLATRFPGRIVPPTQQTQFPINDRRRYRTPESW